MQRDVQRDVAPASRLDAGGWKPRLLDAMRRILVIEDDRAAREVITRTLRTAGYQVLTATDGGEGLVVWEKEQPDLIVTDLHMPNVDGLEAIRALRGRGATIPIIAISGGDSHRSFLALESANDLGATTVLEKPFDPQQLAAVVAKALGD